MTNKLAPIVSFPFLALFGFMNLVMFREANYLKVFNSIVRSVVVFMMNIFMAFELSPNEFFHDYSVFSSWEFIPWHSNLNVPILPIVDSNFSRDTLTRTSEFSCWARTNKVFSALVAFNGVPFAPINIILRSPIFKDMFFDCLFSPSAIFHFFESNFYCTFYSHENILLIKGCTVNGL